MWRFFLLHNAHDLQHERHRKIMNKAVLGYPPNFLFSSLLSNLLSNVCAMITHLYQCFYHCYHHHHHHIFLSRTDLHGGSLNITRRLATPTARDTTWAVCEHVMCWRGQQKPLRPLMWGNEAQSKPGNWDFFFCKYVLTDQLGCKHV